ncbi:MAG: hypothetical protein KKG75_04090 [Nanoarchaeota archaeon]|nr:hypothetical protein [Nanoarchaeota archaeon]
MDQERTKRIAENVFIGILAYAAVATLATQLYYNWDNLQGLLKTQTTSETVVELDSLSYQK